MVYVNKNPCHRAVGDCVIRAVSIVTDQSWEETYIDLAIQGFMMCDMPSSNAVFGAYLRDKGFTRHTIPYDCTIADFAYDHPYGVYVVGTGTHVVAVIDGTAYDAWDSSNEIAQYYYEKHTHETYTRRDR